MKTGRSHGRVWTAQETGRLRELRMQGLGYPAIAAHLGRTEAAIKTRCRDLGLYKPKTEAPGKGEPMKAGLPVVSAVSRSDRVLDMHARGMSFADIGRALSLSPAWVRQIVDSNRTAPSQEHVYRRRCEANGKAFLAALYKAFPACRAYAHVGTGEQRAA